MKEEEEKAREQRRKELPEAPWVGAWQMRRTKSRRWRTVQRSGEAEGAAWEEGRPEGSPECSYGSARRPDEGIVEGGGEKGMSIREKLILWSLGKLLHLTNNDQQHTAGDNDIKHA